jgi:hypothetical protein
MSQRRMFLIVAMICATASACGDNGKAMGEAVCACLDKATSDPKVTTEVLMKKLGECSTMQSDAETKLAANQKELDAFKAAGAACENFGTLGD